MAIPSLQGGGAERVLADLAGHWVRTGNGVTLLTLDDITPVDYPLPANVRRISLGLMSTSCGVGDSVRQNLRRKRALRRQLHDLRPDCAISFIPSMNDLMLLAAGGQRIPVIVSERVDPRHHHIPRVWSWMRWLCYRRAAAVVVQTESVKSALHRFAPQSRAVVIPNAAPQVGTITPFAQRQTEIVAMGRLTHQKGFDRLLQAFATVSHDFPSWRLVILGDGPDRAQLEGIARELKIADRLDMPGWVTDPRPYLHRAACFALSSRYEGFPNALLEAMACGLPAVSFNCDSGPADIIRPDIDGLLVPADDVGEFANGLQTLMAETALRESLSAHAPEISQRFSPDRIFKLWDQLVTKVISESR